MFNWSNLSWKHLFIVLLILHLMPIWIFAYFPSQDGVSHVYNGLVLTEYAKHENHKLRDAWQLNITVFPNWLSHILLALLLYVFPPVIAEKVFLTLAIGMIPIAFFYFVDAVHKRGFTFAWLGFPFAYNYLLYMGFYNFTLSISFFFFSFGFWWKHKEEMQVKHLTVLYVLLLLTYLSHIASYGLVVLGISVAAGSLWGGKALAETWQARSERATAMLRQFVVSLKPFSRFLLYMIPMYFVLMGYYLQSMKQYQQGNHRGLEWIWEYFLGIKSIVYFTDWHIPINHVLLAVLGVAVIISLGYRIHRRQWVKPTDAFLLIALLFTYMFIRAPWSYGHGGWINDRIHLYILLMLVPWLIPNMGKLFRHTLTACLIIFTLIHFGRTAYDHGRIAPEIEELVTGTRLIEPHTVFEIRAEDWHKSEALGKIEYVTPFVHSASFYGVYANDVVHLANYESAYNYFPVNRNTAREKIPVDYVVAWYDSKAEKELTEEGYEIIHETKHLQLFRKKRARGPNLELWQKSEDGNLIIRFDMQPHNAQTAENYHAIGPNTVYESGKFGWDTSAPHEAYHAEKSKPALIRDAVWGKEDAAFKLDLPNGTYRVTNTFCAAENAVHTVNLLANRKSVLKKFTIRRDNVDIPHTFSGKVPGERPIVYDKHGFVEHVYTVEVTDGYLTQVIFTPKRRVGTEEEWDRKHNYWIWNGCTVEQIAASDESER